MALKGFENVPEKVDIEKENGQLIEQLHELSTTGKKPHRLNINMTEAQYRELTIRTRTSGFKYVKDYVLNKLEL